MSDNWAGVGTHHAFTHAIGAGKFGLQATTFDIGASGVIIVFSKLNVKPEKRTELLQTVHALVADIRKKAGCLKSQFYQNCENENELLLMEVWENRTALDDHLHSESFTVLMGAGSLLEMSPEFELHTISHSSELINLNALRKDSSK